MEENKKLIYIPYKDSNYIFTHNYSQLQIGKKQQVSISGLYRTFPNSSFCLYSNCKLFIIGGGSSENDDSCKDVYEIKKISFASTFASEKK